jgi:hypothetical protein
MTTSNGTIAIQTLIEASASIEQGVPGAGLSLMQDASGNNLGIVTANGCTAGAYRDANGDVIIAFQGTTTDIQLALDRPLASGKPVSGLAGFTDALAFASSVRAAAAASGIDPGRVYVTGHSLGASLAEYVAQQTGLAGAAFAGSGLGGNENGQPAPNFVSFVGLGDPFANDATDAGEADELQSVTSQMDHVGEVVRLGDGNDFATLLGFVSAASAAGISVASDPIAALTASGPAFTAAWSQHALSIYAAQIAVRYGDATLAQIAASNGPADAAYDSNTGLDQSGTVFTVRDAPGSNAVIDLGRNDAAKVVFGGNAALDLIAGNTTIVLNGVGQDGAVTIDSLGGNAVWMGSAAVDYLSGGHTVFVLGDANGVSSSLAVQGGDASASNEFLVWGVASETQTIETDGQSPSLVFGGGAALDFRGGNATIVLDGPGQTGSATIESQGGNTIWSGRANLDLTEGSGDDLILLDGASTTRIIGASGADTGSTHVEALANNGDFTYQGGAKTARLDLGGGQNNVSGGSAAQTITMNGSGTLTVTDTAESTGMQTIQVARAGLFTFLGGGNDASLALGAGSASIEAGSGNTTLTGGAGTAHIDLSHATAATLSFDGATSGMVDIVGFDPATASIHIADAMTASIAGGSLVVALADRATVTIHGDTDPNHAGIFLG